VPLLALSIPLLDVSLSVLRRLLRNQPIFTADRRHIHHRLLDRGFSARQAVWVLYLFATLAAAWLCWPVPVWAANRRLWRLLCSVWPRDRHTPTALLGIRHSRPVPVWRRLKRALDGRLRLERLTWELERASDERNWWATLVEGARGLGMSEIRWIGLDGERTETLAPLTARRGPSGYRSPTSSPSRSAALSATPRPHSISWDSRKTHAGHFKPPRRGATRDRGDRQIMKPSLHQGNEYSAAFSDLFACMAGFGVATWAAGRGWVRRRSRRRGRFNGLFRPPSLGWPSSSRRVRCAAGTAMGRRVFHRHRV